MNKKKKYISKLAKEKVKHLSEEEKQKKIQNIIAIHDKVIESIFSDNKNNILLTYIVNILRKQHGLPKIPQIIISIVQKAIPYNN
ncbi:MAG: hypothetical protein FWF57_01085, partial [Defluviitaleaceae bacterium]|nr:hypothetical protein [Defluviitaleaceae bacterium]